MGSGGWSLAVIDDFDRDRWRAQSRSSIRAGGRGRTRRDRFHNHGDPTPPDRSDLSGPQGHRFWLSLRACNSSCSTPYTPFFAHFFYLQDVPGFAFLKCTYAGKRATCRPRCLVDKDLKFPSEFQNRADRVWPVGAWSALGDLGARIPVENRVVLAGNRMFLGDNRSDCTSPDTPEGRQSLRVGADQAGHFPAFSAFAPTAGFRPLTIASIMASCLRASASEGTPSSRRRASLTPGPIS